MSTKPFLILQLRPEDDGADGEFQSILDKSGLTEAAVERRRLDQNTDISDIQLENYSGVIVGGGPGCVSNPPEKKTELEASIEDAVLSLMPAITEQDFPFMGCCYGIGILAHHLGATVSKEKYNEDVGPVLVRKEAGADTDPLLSDLPEEFYAYVGHKEAVQELPNGCVHLLSSATCPYQMIRYRENVYATQFHPEPDNEAFAARIMVYKNHGYFPPETAEELVAHCNTFTVDQPEKILKAFVERYWS